MAPLNRIQLFATLKNRGRALQLTYICYLTVLSIFLFSSTSYAANPATKIPANSTTSEASTTLNLQTIIERVLRESPRLKSASSAVAASKGERLQSGLYKNPEIGVQAENIAGTGSYKGMRSAEITYGLSQVIEIGGKRSSRIKMGEQGVALSRYKKKIETLDVIRDVTVAYINAIATQKMLELATEQKEIAEELHREVNQRVDAAREPLIQKSKAQITLATAQFSFERSKRELDLTKYTLSNLWGGHDNNFSLDQNFFFNLTEPPTKDKVEENLDKTAFLKHAEANYARMQAEYGLEKANSIPDPHLNVGVRNLREAGKQAFVVGFSVPLPVFNQNQGNIKRARHEVSKAKSDIKATQLAMINAKREALNAQGNAYLNAHNLETSILPSAQKAFTLSLQGYRAGKFPYLEVLDAQRTLFQVKEQYIEALKEYHIAKAEVDRLTASHLTTSHAEHTESKEGKNEA